ncbi:hypothetical protein GCM10029964_124900 [Kibdelosporangium lantanae]
MSGLTPGEILTSLITLTTVYGALAVLEYFLVRRYARAGIAGVLPKQDNETEHDALAFAY